MRFQVGVQSLYLAHDALAVLLLLHLAYSVHKLSRIARGGRLERRVYLSNDGVQAFNLGHIARHGHEDVVEGELPEGYKEAGAARTVAEQKCYVQLKEEHFQRTAAAATHLR